ncbi:hypothetical protein BCR44DRAFT_1438924, partial [Catenaria anguillulae PL171]
STDRGARQSSTKSSILGRLRLSKSHGSSWVEMSSNTCPNATSAKTSLAELLQDNLVIALFLPAHSRKSELIFVSDIFARHGVPSVLYSDRGACGSQEVHHVWSSRCKFASASPYNPRVNGIVEHGHHKLLQAFEETCQLTGRECQELVPAVA